MHNLSISHVGYLPLLVGPGLSAAETHMVRGQAFSITHLICGYTKQE